MCSTVSNRPKCTCSAFFETEEDLERHLDDNIQQQRLRDQWVQWLQTEARGRDHARVDSHAQSDENEVEHEHNYSRNGEAASTERGGPRSSHQCPTCSRIKPFATKQKLRRHFEQHIECHEVCVICTKVFRFVREFLRHAEKCVGENKRKMIYMKDTCEELREFSNNELDIALGENEQRQSQGKKRTWDEANISIGISTARANSSKPEPEPEPVALQPTNNPLSTDQISVHTTEGLFPAFTHAVGDAELYPARTSTETMLPGAASSSQEPSIVFPGVHDSSLDMVESFDAPLMHIMNGVPLFLKSVNNEWTWPSSEQ